MPLSIADTVALLEASERGEPLPPSYRDQRYVVLHGMDPEVMRDPPEEDDPLLAKGQAWIGLRVAGEAKDLEGALRLLWGSMEALRAIWTGGEEDEDDEATWQSKLATALSEGPWGVPDDEVGCATNFGVGTAKSVFPKSRYALAVFGDAPYEGENACILELPPDVPLSGLDAELVGACREGDVARAAAALEKGANARVVDEHGDTPLHHAFARRSLPLARLLADAGADLDAQAAFTHAPVFAKYQDDGSLLPGAGRFDGEDHFELVRFLVERGASPLSKGPYGETLVDVAAQASPMNERWVRFFLDRGVSSRLLRRSSGSVRRPLDDLLSALHYDTPETRAKIPDWIRLLGWLGCDPNSREDHGGKRTALEDFLGTGYSDDEVEPEVMTRIAESLVAIGARDEVGEWEKTPSERADKWANHNEAMKHYAKVAEILRRGRPAERTEASK